MSDLASLLAAAVQARSQPDAVTFSSGVVEIYASFSGENQIRLGGENGPLLVNVPVLNNSVRLSRGDVVALLKFKSSYFILGRISVPGSVATFGGGVHAGFCNESNSGFGMSASLVEKVSDVVWGPAWAKTAFTFVTGTVQAYNGSGATDYMHVECSIDGNRGYQSFIQGWTAGFPSATATLSLPDQSGARDFSVDPIEVAVSAYSENGGWGASASNYATVSAQTIFFG